MLLDNSPKSVHLVPLDWGETEEQSILRYCKENSLEPDYFADTKSIDIIFLKSFD